MNTECVEVPLNGGFVMLIDREDLPLIAAKSITAFRDHNTAYACFNRLPLRGVGVHRMIAKAKPCEFVDHINRNGLDNRKENLRIVDRSQNACNSKRRKDASLQYRGVKLNKTDGKFHARISINGKRRHLGSFNTLEEAAKAYDVAAREHRGAFAKLNFAEGRAE